MNDNTNLVKTFLSLSGLTLEDLQRALFELQDACQCEFRELTADELDDEWMSVGARCLKCGQGRGWRCKESPDSVCHYRSRNRCIKLLGGALYALPDDYDDSNESDDWCVFCGLPDERK